MDAPFHTNRHGWSVAEVPSERLLFLPIALIDVSLQASKNSSFQVDVNDIELWEQHNGRVPEGAFVVVRTGWYKVSKNVS